MEDLYDVFISHSSKDKSRYIVPLTNAFDAQGITYWLDNVEIAWGDAITGKINEGIRNSRYVLLCLSSNYLKREWPEAEMNAALTIQNSSGKKRVLPLILNSKRLVLQRYPLLAGLALEEFRTGARSIAKRVAELTHMTSRKPGEIRVIVESVHTGTSCELFFSPRASIRLLADRARECLGLSEFADAGAYRPFKLRWVLVDARAEEHWTAMDRDEQREQILVADGEKGIFTASQYTQKLEQTGIYDGIVFHLYPVEDIDYPDYGPAAAAAW